MMSKELEGRALWTHHERKISSNCDLGTEVNVAVGVADRKRGVTRGQGFGSHSAAVILAWCQPPWMSRKRVGGSQNRCSMTMNK